MKFWDINIQSLIPSPMTTGLLCLAVGVGCYSWNYYQETKQKLNINCELNNTDEKKGDENDMAKGKKHKKKAKDEATGKINNQSTESTTILNNTIQETEYKKINNNVETNSLKPSDNKENEQINEILKEYVVLDHARIESNVQNNKLSNEQIKTLNDAMKEEKNAAAESNEKTDGGFVLI